MRTAFFANVARQVGDVSPDDPYGELLTRFNATMAALGSAGQTADSVAEVILDIVADPSPALRYQASDQARALAAQKLVDPTGRSVLAATGMLLHPEPTGTTAASVL